MSSAQALVKISRRLGKAVDALDFGPPVTHVYNPLRHARALHERFLETYGGGQKEVVLVGMNPGPWGMAQTGVPFGDPGVVRNWMGLSGKVGKPANEHPKRPVKGLASERSEVSGTRLWGWAAERYGSADDFFERFFVLNHCPLSFMEESGRNRTPDKLPKEERDPLFAACDEALRASLEVLKPTYAVGVGAYAEKRIELVAGDLGLTIGRILHPSPASPIANRGWAPQAEKDFERLGIRL